MIGMDDIRMGRVCRALRRRRGWRQADLAARAGCHQTTISRLERGQVASLTLDIVRRIFGALEGRFEGYVSWRGGELDRLLDARHAALVEATAAVYRRDGWTTHVEVSFSRFGERGSIDVLAVREKQRIVAVNEIKSEITAVEETHRRHDAKVRLARDIVEERFGWRPVAVARVLIVPEDASIRRLVRTHAATFAASYPQGSRDVRRWIREPMGSLAGLWFLSGKPGWHASQVRAGRVRVSTSRRSSGV